MMDGSGEVGVFTSLEVCAGAGGQAIGLEQAGFRHLALCEIDKHAQATLELNRPQWNVLKGRDADIRTFDAKPYFGVDLLAGGLPCPPFSIAGRKLGAADERNLFPDFLRIVSECRPKAVLIENVKGFLDPKFEDFRLKLRRDFNSLGYEVDWKLLNSSDYGVPQLRPRVAIVALPSGVKFSWPIPISIPPVTVGKLLRKKMAENGWQGANEWAQNANRIAPTIVGGSHKHGGPDLGPTRARKAWADLGVEGRSLADEAPAHDHTGNPRLTVPMVALIQGFPENWRFVGRKTPAYRQVGNAFPPPVAAALGAKINAALHEIRALA